jgi:broad specificity phosphatase PhoE
MRCGDHKMPLTTQGVEQASKAGIELNSILGIDSFRVICSPYTRTKQTYTEIRKHVKKHDFELDPLIREQEWKVFPNEQNIKEVLRERKKYSDFWYRFKNAESKADLFQRLRLFYNTLQTRRLLGEFNKTDSLVIITHQTAIQLLVKIIKKQNPMVKYPTVNNCQIIVLNLN